MEKKTRKCKVHIGGERIVIENNGTRCKLCYEKNKQDKIKKNINKAKEIHNNKYDYSLVKYEKTTEKIIIICLEHGEFKQHIWNHLKGRGCPDCARKQKTHDKYIVVKKFTEIHGDIYDYSLVEYINDKVKVKIICKKHGVFQQNSMKHKSGQGCPSCRMSHGEQKIERFLENNQVLYEKQKKFEDCKNLNRLPFDFYLNEYEVCIEYDGEQHFEPRFENTEKSILNFEKIKKNDLIKEDFCKKNEIKLLRIPYFEKKNIEKIIEKEILKWKKIKKH